MKRIRVIPVLLISGRRLVKTTRFRSPLYVGDPLNAIRILNEKEVDEIVILDITASRNKTGPDIEYIQHLAGECFMPMAYGGGVTNVEQAAMLFQNGIEKVVLGFAAHSNPNLISILAEHFGSQSIVVSLDVDYDFLKRPRVYTLNGRQKVSGEPWILAKKFEQFGAGEIMLQSIGRDGTQTGYDLTLIQKTTASLTIPTIVAGGARDINDYLQAVKHGASAVAAGSMFLFKGPHRAVLISYPTQETLITNLYNKL